MSDHECLHEADWAVFRDHQTDMSRDLKMVLKMLRGNGEPGIVTKMALQEQCMKKLHERLDDYEEDLRSIRGRVWTALIGVVMLIAATCIKLWIGA